MTVRQAKADNLTSLINQAAAEFKELHTATGALGELLYKNKVEKSFQRHGKAPNMIGEVVPGMSSISARVQTMVEYSIFGIGRNGVDLVQLIAEENAASLSEVEL
jgi:hypothetical protein